MTAKTIYYPWFWFLTKRISRSSRFSEGDQWRCGEVSSHLLRNLMTGRCWTSSANYVAIAGAGGWRRSASLFCSPRFRLRRIRWPLCLHRAGWPVALILFPCVEYANCDRALCITLSKGKSLGTTLSIQGVLFDYFGMISSFILVVSRSLVYLSLHLLWVCDMFRVSTIYLCACVYVCMCVSIHIRTLSIHYTYWES